MFFFLGVLAVQSNNSLLLEDDSILYSQKTKPSSGPVQHVDESQIPQSQTLSDPKEVSGEPSKDSDVPNSASFAALSIKDSVSQGAGVSDHVTDSSSSIQASSSGTSLWTDKQSQPAQVAENKR